MKNYSRTKGKSAKVSYRTPSRIIIKKVYDRGQIKAGTAPHNSPQRQQRFS